VVPVPGKEARAQEKKWTWFELKVVGGAPGDQSKSDSSVLSLGSRQLFGGRLTITFLLPSIQESKKLASKSASNQVSKILRSALTILFD
jgi:hypothetical protein